MPSGTWSVNAGGNWSNSANWVSTTIADGAGFTANFTRDITAQRTVTVDTMRTIGNLAFNDTVAAIFPWVLARSATNTLTLDNGVSKPAINCTTAAAISAVLAGTNGFEKQGSGGILYLYGVGTISGEVVVIDQFIYLGDYNTGTTDVLPSISGYNLNVPTFGGLTYQGTGDFTETKPISATSATRLFMQRPNKVTFSNSSISTFPGLFILATDGTIASNSIDLGANVPTGANFRGDVYVVTGGTTRTSTIILAPTSPATLTGYVQGYASTASTGGVLVLQVDGTSSATFSGDFVRTLTSSTSSTMTIQLGGSNPNCSATGRIRNTAGAAAGVLALRKADAGSWVISGDNDYTGNTSISAGTLSARSNTAFGSSASGVVTQTGGTIEVTNGTALNKGALGLTLVSVAGSTALKSTSGANSFTCGAVTLSSTIPVDVSSGASLALNNSSAITGGAFGITKNGDGEFSLPAVNNTYTGAVTINAGTLSVGSVATIGLASALGTGAGTSAISVAGTLKFTGTSVQSTDRSLTLSGGSPTIDASGTGIGSVTYSAATQANTTKTITFTGSGTNNNTASFNIGDTSFVTSLSKAGVGKWILTGGTIDYTGATTVSAGTLNLGSANRVLAGGVSISGGTIENGTSTLNTSVTMTGGTITAVLTGTGKTFDVTSGTATINPASADGSNTFTGTSTISSGATLKLISSAEPSTSGNGKALGDSAVAVNGRIETGYSQTQRGQIRFGGSVTFGNGSEIHIGAAA
jgi:fibronectin-binding autotransporter adhesin